MNGIDWKTIFNVIGHSICILDLQQNILAINPASLKMLDKSEEKVLGKKCYEVFHGASEPLENCPMQKMLVSGHFETVEVEMEALNRTFMVSCTPLLDDEGKLGKVIHMATDITEYKQTRDLLLKSEEKYHRLIETANDAIFIADAETGIILEANRKAGEMLGIPVKKIIGMHQSKLHPKKESAKYSKIFKKHIQEGQAITEPLYVVNKSGNKIPIEISASVLTLGDKQVILGIFRDITNRKQVEIEIKENERFLIDVLNSIQDGLSILDKDMNIIRVNPAMEYWYSHAMPLVGKKCYMAYHGRNERCDVCPSHQTLDTSKSAYEVVPKRGPDGKIVGWLDLYSFPLINTATDQIVGVIEYVRDITERKRAEENLKKSEKILKIHTRELEESNIALKVLLKQRGEDKIEFEENILSNMKHLVMPYIEKLKKHRAMSDELAYLNIIESSLNEIISPFSSRLSSKYLGLTPKETQIANLIKDGKQDKDIMKIMNIAPVTVKSHRQNIRKKLGIYGKKINLRTYLLSISK